MAGRLTPSFTGDQLCVAIDFKILGGIDFKDVEIFVKPLSGLTIVLRANFRSNFIPTWPG